MEEKLEVLNQEPEKPKRAGFWKTLSLSFLAVVGVANKDKIEDGIGNIVNKGTQSAQTFSAENQAGNQIVSFQKSEIYKEDFEHIQQFTGVIYQTVTKFGKLNSEEHSKVRQAMQHVRFAIQKKLNTLDKRSKEYKQLKDDANNLVIGFQLITKQFLDEKVMIPFEDALTKKFS